MVKYLQCPACKQPMVDLSNDPRFVNHEPDKLLEDEDGKVHGHIRIKMDRRDPSSPRSNPPRSRSGSSGIKSVRSRRGKSVSNVVKRVNLLKKELSKEQGFRFSNNGKVVVWKGD